MKLLFLFFIVGAFSAHALETANFLAWGTNLPDSGDDLNSLIRTQIEEVLESQNENQTCEQVTFNIAHRFKTTPTRKLFEDWSAENLVSKSYPSNPFYLKQSIYRDTARIYLNHSGLSPNLQVRGIYFGVDKLSHFGSTGRRYLMEYLKIIKRGNSPEEAEKAAIRFGLANEGGILGLWASGVFSYGDMEANYQGLRFYKKLCLDQKDTYLKNIDGRWTLVKVPDIEDYVNPYWDESFNLSYLEATSWEKSSRIIKEEYCPLKNTEAVKTRMRFYQGLNHTSPSLAYIEELKQAGYKQAPDPLESQSITKLCASLISY